MMSSDYITQCENYVKELYQGDIIQKSMGTVLTTYLDSPSDWDDDSFQSEIVDNLMSVTEDWVESEMEGLDDIPEWMTEFIQCAS